MVGKDEFIILKIKKIKMATLTMKIILALLCIIIIFLPAYILYFYITLRRRWRKIAENFNLNYVNRREEKIPEELEFFQQNSFYYKISVTTIAEGKKSNSEWKLYKIFLSHYNSHHVPSMTQHIVVSIKTHKKMPTFSIQKRTIINQLITNILNNDKQKYIKKNKNIEKNNLVDLDIYIEEVSDKIIVSAKNTQEVKAFILKIKDELLKSTSGYKSLQIEDKKILAIYDIEGPIACMKFPNKLRELEALVNELNK